MELTKYQSLPRDESESSTLYLPTKRKWATNILQNRQSRMIFLAMAVVPLICLGAIFSIYGEHIKTKGQAQDLQTPTAQQLQHPNTQQPQLQNEPEIGIPKPIWVKMAQDTDIDGPFDHSAIHELCETTTWREGLVLALTDETVGGICNVRNVFVNYVRFAIEAGAGIVIPKMGPRNVSDPAKFQAVFRDFSFLFDREYFKSNLLAACPMITIYDDIEDLPDEPWAQSTTKLCLQCLDGESLWHGYTMASSDLWRSKFDNWLQQENVTTSRDDPRLFWVPPPFLSRNILQEKPLLFRTLGRLFTAPPKIRDIAARVLYELNKKFQLSIDPSLNGIAKSAYYGAHLRTERDAAQAGMMGYDVQAPFFMTNASAAKLSIIYAASFREEDLARLKVEAKEQYGIEVTTKYDLLKMEDLEALRELSFDQAAQVDYAMLLKSSLFGGISASSFSYNIAVKRATSMWDDKLQWTEKELDPSLRPWWNGDSSELQNPRDSLSTLLSTAGELFAETIWP